MTNTQKAKFKLPKLSRASLSERKARKGWLFVLPFVLGFVLVYLPIIIDSICFSFMKPEIQTNAQGSYTVVVNHGLEYYRKMFSSNSDYVQKLLGGISQLLWEVPTIVIFALFIAVILNQKMLGRAVFRAIFFVPVILSTGLMEKLTMQALSGAGEEAVDDGSGVNARNDLVSAMDVEMLFSRLELGTAGAGAFQSVAGIVQSVYSIVNYSGVQMLIFLAGLQSISPSIYEAARIDGASAWETFWKITFPMISPMILVNGIYTIIDSFTRNNNSVMTYIDGIYSDKNQSLATAEYWVYFLIIFAIVGVFGGIVSAYVFYQRRE